MTKRNHNATNKVLERSFEQLEAHHLRRLAGIAIRDLDRMYDRNPETADRYRDRLMLLCLCKVRPGILCMEIAA